MEHIIVTERTDGYYLLVAEEGWKLYNVNTQRTYSEAVVAESDMKMWSAVEA